MGLTANICILLYLRQIIMRICLRMFYIYSNGNSISYVEELHVEIGHPQVVSRSDMNTFINALWN